MKPYYVLWTYEANYSPLFKVEAENPDKAAAEVTEYFNSNFHEKGTTYVFDTPPVLVKGQTREARKWAT